MKMNKRLKHNMKVIGIYSIVIYIILLPFQMWFTGISISILLGFLFNLGNDIITQLRKLNGEKFPNLEEKEDDKIEMIKS